MKLTISHDTIKALLLIAPKSDIRYYLNGVCVDVRAGLVTLVATDGHRLLAVPVSADNVEDARNGEFIIPRDTLEAVKPAKYGKIAAQITIELPVMPSGSGTLQTVSVTGTTTATAQVFDNKYPDWRRVTPTSASNEPAQFNSEYLGSFGKVSELLGAKTKTGVTAIIHHNGDAAALVTFPTSQALGVIMPLRVDNDKHPGLPAWAQMTV
jgi:DNA polymerase-3 subunit beta